MKGSLFIVSAPSGAGKTSLVNALVQQEDNIVLSVSHTTRPARVGEVDGKDYFFLSQEQFIQMQGKGEFLESATVFDNSYGTSSLAVFEQLQQGNDVILEIDWQGAEQVRKNYAECIGVFIMPPSRAALEERLRGRGQDDNEIIARRMKDAGNEMSHYIEFDYLLINDNFEQTLTELKTLISAQRHKMTIQAQVQESLLKELLV